MRKKGRGLLREGGARGGGGMGKLGGGGRMKRPRRWLGIRISRAGKGIVSERLLRKVPVGEREIELRERGEKDGVGEGDSSERDSSERAVRGMVVRRMAAK